MVKLKTIDIVHPAGLQAFIADRVLAPWVTNLISLKVATQALPE
jgi:hypothetical protein